MRVSLATPVSGLETADKLVGHTISVHFPFAISFSWPISHSEIGTYAADSSNSDWRYATLALRKSFDVVESIIPDAYQKDISKAILVSKKPRLTTKLSSYRFGTLSR
jgi:hypothetical protein